MSKLTQALVLYFHFVTLNTVMSTLPSWCTSVLKTFESFVILFVRSCWSLFHIPRCFICFHLRPFVVALARLLCCHSFTRYFVQCFASDYSISHTDYFGMFVMGIVTSFDFRRLCCKLACFHQSLEFLSGDEKQLAVHFCSFIIFWQFSPSIWCNCLAMTDVHYVVV